jgi:hypothetical protein
MIAFILFAIITKLVAVFGKDTAPWIKSTETNSLGSLTFRLELFKQRLDVLESLFWQISDPKHEKFRQYLTKNEIFERYLNVVQFGPKLFGIKAASQKYFKKSL